MITLAPAELGNDGVGDPGRSVAGHDQPQRTRRPARSMPLEFDKDEAVAPAWSSIACPPAGIAVTSDCAASASLMTDFASVSTHDGLRRVFVGIKDDISFQPACTPS